MDFLGDKAPKLRFLINMFFFISGARLSINRIQTILVHSVVFHFKWYILLWLVFHMPVIYIYKELIAVAENQHLSTLLFLYCFSWVQRVRIWDDMLFTLYKCHVFVTILYGQPCIPSYPVQTKRLFFFFSTIIIKWFI